MPYSSYLHNNSIGTCNNPHCATFHSLKDAQDQALKTGVAFAHCGKIIFQVIECRIPGCSGNVIFRSDADNPAIDIRRLILVPIPSGLVNSHEQAWILRNRSCWHDYLKFQIIPAWDNSAIHVDEFMDSFKREPPILFNPVSPDSLLSMSEEAFNAHLHQESISGKNHLRRLIPDTPKSRKLLTCLAPNKIRDIESPGVVHADGTASEDLINRRETWKTLLEEAMDQTFEDAVREKLASKGIVPPEPSKIRFSVDQELFYKASSLREQLWSVVLENGFAGQLDGFFKKAVKSIFYPICTEFALDSTRKELLEWPDQVKQGKALFVDAPMGLGKTYSIAEALASNPTLSAVIFMPTNKLCQEIIENLKYRISLHRKIDDWASRTQREQVFDVKGMPEYDEDGLLKYRYKRSFLQDEVYYNDGINEKECSHFNEIIDRYREKWIKRKDICKECNKFAYCRFRFHWKNAPLSRIVVTTHHNYDRLYRSSNIRKWYKDGYYEKDKDEKLIKDKDDKLIKIDGVERNFFIVDEDLVLSQCYQPTSLDHKKVKAFISTVTNFLKDYANTKDIRKNIHSFFGQVMECDKTAIICPIDPKFKIPRKIVDEWEESFYQQPSIIPETLDWSGIVGNCLDVVKNAIRLGAVVERWSNRYLVHFPNPKSYDLSRLPPHVFFDGTMLDKKLLKKKLLKVDFDRKKIHVKVPWNLNVCQNINTDLPKKWIARDEDNVKKFVRELINELGMDHKYFFITTRAIRDEYLDDFLDQEYPNLNPVLVHYGSLRGINEAKECDIGIMIGSCLISDSVEIAMALEFIQSNLRKQGPILTENNLWTWKGSKGQRVYKDEYAIVGKIAKAFRLNEHRQAIARTRYIFHDVDFYVLSKDPVDDDDFEPNAQVKDYQYRSDIFPPRPERPDSKYEQVKKAVNNLIREYGSAIEMKIHQETKISRTTIRNHLKRMLGNGELAREGTKYKPPHKPENG